MIIFDIACVNDLELSYKNEDNELINSVLSDSTEDSASKCSEKCEATENCRGARFIIASNQCLMYTYYIFGDYSQPVSSTEKCIMKSQSLINESVGNCWTNDGTGFK